MKLLFSCLTIILLLATAICACTKGKHTSRQTTNVTIKAGEEYAYNLGSFGDDEGATITRQAMHYQISTANRDTTFFSNITYHYKPALNYVGTDAVELTSQRGSDGSGPNNIIVITTIKFTVTE